MTGLDELTGLPEYRNGGLLLDLGVIVPMRRRLPAAVGTAVGDEAIVEWRALTVIALDRIAAAVRAELGVDARTPFRSRACSKAARGRRAGASPPSAARRRTPRCRSTSDGTVF